jgi:hypothetical protein
VRREPPDDEQFDLGFFPKKLARREDPSTSKAAALECGELRSRHHRLIYNTLKKIGNGTIYEISDACGLNENAVARRMKELETANRAMVIGERLGHAHRMCRVWTAV